MTFSVSICLVTYNRCALLPATIDSLLAQTFADFELIISDDCSMDDTERICREYAVRDSRVRYRRNPVNLNMPGNVNSCLQEASGVYVANLHDGDVYHADFIEKCKDALDRYPSAGFVFNGYRVVDGGEVKTYTENYPPLIPGRELGARLLSRWDSCVYGTVVARREVYERIGLFDSQFGNYSDVDMWMRIARHYDVAYIPDVLIDLMPRDPARFYAGVSWKVVFWILGMHVANLQRYADVLPELTAELARAYPERRRRYVLAHLQGCLRRLQWRQIRELAAICRDADDPLLQHIGALLGPVRRAPDWYGPEYWRMVKTPDLRSCVACAGRPWASTEYGKGA